MEGLTLITFGIEMSTAAETVEGGSKDSARSMILFSAPDWASASFLLLLFREMEIPGY